MRVILIIFAALVPAIGQIFLKSGLKKIKPVLAEKFFTWENILNILKIPSLWLGIILYGASVFIYLLVLYRSDVSTAYPMIASLAYIGVILFATIFLGETMNSYKIIGVVFIIFGAFLLYKQM